ncbi:MAG: HPr kinase/phosphorylase [Pseudomonadota bacterium]
MAELSSETIHASCVAIDGRALLIEGASGDGKSDLALRLIDRGATLVSDDYTVCQRHDGVLLASPPPNIAGKIEVRGVGIVEVDYVAQMPVALMVRIFDHPPRLPDPTLRRIGGVEIPVIMLPALEASAPIKAEIALRSIGR